MKIIDPQLNQYPSLTEEYCEEWKEKRMTPEQEREMQNEMLLKQVTQIVGDFLVKMNYAGISFVHSKEHKHIGVEIVPHPTTTVNPVIQLIH